MLPSPKWTPPAPPPPDYARYDPISYAKVLEVGGSPYQGILDQYDLSLMRAHAAQWEHLFEYVKFDELGIPEVYRWCRKRFGREFLRVGNTRKGNDTARWWCIEGGHMIAFANHTDAFEFKMRWV